MRNAAVLWLCPLLNYTRIWFILGLLDLQKIINIGCNGNLLCAVINIAISLLFVCAGWQWRSVGDRTNRWPLGVGRNGVARNQMRCSVSARRVHANHLLQAVAAEHHRSALNHVRRRVRAASYIPTRRTVTNRNSVLIAIGHPNKTNRVQVSRAASIAE